MEAFLNIGNRTLIRRSEIVSLSLICQDEVRDALKGLAFLLPKTEHSFSFALRLAGGTSINLPILSDDKDAVLEDWERIKDWYTSGEGVYTLNGEEKPAPESEK